MEGRYGLQKVPLHLNAFSLHVSVQLCSATSRTATRPSTTGSLWVLLTTIRNYCHLWIFQGLSNVYLCHLLFQQVTASLCLTVHVCNCWRLVMFSQMHYLLYGAGMQTWEYSPLYAIRSYAYLWLHALPACLHAHVLQTNKVTIPNLLSFQRLLLLLRFEMTLADLEHNAQLLFCVQLKKVQICLFQSKNKPGYILRKLQACVMVVLQVLVFYFVRCVLAFSCCVCELYFYKWVYTPSTLAYTFVADYVNIDLILWFVCVSDAGQFVRSLVCTWAVLCWHSSSWARECSARLLVGQIYSLA